MTSHYENNTREHDSIRLDDGPLLKLDNGTVEMLKTIDQQLNKPYDERNKVSSSLTKHRIQHLDSLI